jgi:hypothetical protein
MRRDKNISGWGRGRGGGLTSRKKKTHWKELQKRDEIDDVDWPEKSGGVGIWKGEGK